MSRRWLLATVLAGLPVLAGLALWLAFRLGWLPDYLIYLRSNLGRLLLLAGLALSLLAGVVAAFAAVLQRRSGQQVAQVQAQAALQRRQFLQRLDHELKNPLTALQVELANLGAEGEPPESGEPSLAGQQSGPPERLKEQVLRLNELVIQLRKLGELETVAIEHEPVRIDDLLSELVAEFQAGGAGAQRHMTLSLPQVPWPLPEVSGDADLLYLALRNLLGNAVKFTRPGDAIQVRAFEDSTQVIVEIADKGPGIPPDEAPYVWDELFRGQMARGLPGSGLGLALVKAIVERHGGQVGLRSRLNQGTVVTVRLPRV